MQKNIYNNDVLYKSHRNAEYYFEMHCASAVFSKGYVPVIHANWQWVGSGVEDMLRRIFRGLISKTQTIPQIRVCEWTWKNKLEQDLT